MSSRILRLVALVLALGILSCVVLSCESSSPVDPVDPSVDSLLSVIESLKQEIANRDFVIAQQGGMIRCLQAGGSPEDCYGGI